MFLLKKTTILLEIIKIDTDTSERKIYIISYPLRKETSLIR